MSEEFKKKARKKQISQFIIGILFFVLLVFLLFNIGETVLVQSINFIIILILLVLGCMFFCSSLSAWKSDNNYKYYRFSDLLIIFIIMFQLGIIILFLVFGFLNLPYFNFSLLLSAVILGVVGNLSIVVLFDEVLTRKLHTFIVNLFKLDNTPYDKNIPSNVKVAYYSKEKRYVYYIIEDNEIIPYDANSFDGYKYGFRTHIRLLDMLLDFSLLKLYLEGRRTVKNKCRKLRYTIVPFVDGNNNFSYVNKYYCGLKPKKIISKNELDGFCKDCPLE